MRRVIEGERPADVGTELAAAADGTAAARLREEAGVATAPRDDIERGIGAIGTIGRSLPAAGIFCDVMPEPVGAAAGERVPADESLKLVLGAAAGSGARGAMFAAVTGFFINLWWRVCDVGAGTEGVAGAIDREGGTEDSGWATTGDVGETGR